MHNDPGHSDDAEQLQSLNDALEKKAQKIEETKLRLKVTIYDDTHRASMKLFFCTHGAFVCVCDTGKGVSFVVMASYVPVRCLLVRVVGNVELLDDVT